jgi:transposase
MSHEITWLFVYGSPRVIIFTSEVIFMVFVGIDVAKDKHDLYAVDSDGVVLCDNFTFANSAAGFASLLERISVWGKIKVGIEATGHYSSNLLSFLKAHDFEVVVFNPLSVSRLRSAASLRKTKTDKNDSRYIARLLLTGVANPYQSQSYNISVLKSMTRARFRLFQEIQPLKNRFRRLLHVLFPELQGFFSNLYGNTSLNLLSVLPSAKDIAECNILKLTKILSEFSRGMLKRGRAEQLKSLAQNSIATYNYGDAFELKQTVRRIQFLSSQMSEIESEIDSVMAVLNSPITSIPGIGNLLGATILSEIGNIKNFDNPDKLLAFAGCEPSTYQSGKYTATNTPMVKHGSRYLRRALYCAADMAYVNSPSFRSYIDRKRAQGKHYYVAMSHGMKKLVRIIFAVLSRNIPFSEPA